MKNSINLGEVITAMVTPYKKDGSVDLDGAELLASRLLKNGTDTLLLTGSTGEDHQLTQAEKWAVVKRVRGYMPKEAKIMVSTGDKTTMGAIQKTKTAFDLGADAVLISVPEYIKPPQQSIYIHFNAVAKAVPDKPIIIYNVPSRIGAEIMPETVAKLAHANPNIIGIKQSMGNMDRVSEMKMLCPKGFQIYSGDDSLTLPMLALGAKGVISVASHLEGTLIKKMIGSFKKGQVEQAEKIHHLLFPLFKSLFEMSNPMPIKEALYQKHMIDTPVLRTLGRMPPKERGRLIQSLRAFEEEKWDFLRTNNASVRTGGREI